MTGTRHRDAALLAVVVLITRLPFATQRLWEWDSVLYARALEQGFHVSADIADQRPHPPGYAFYVGAASAVRWVMGDSNAALVLISIVASAAAAAAVFLLARRFASREAAAFAALAFAVDPLVWAHSEIALPYVVLALGSVALAALFWDARHGSDRRALVSSVAFGLAAGFRQDLLLVLGPLWLWSLFPGGPRRIAACCLALAVACLLWLAPSAFASGGLGGYVAAVLAQSGTITGHSVAGGSGGDVLWYDLRFTILALAWGLFAVGALLLGLMLAPALHWARRPAVRRPGEPATFFLLWILPGLAVYLLWIIGDWGYVLSILPALYVLCAALLTAAFSRAHGAVVAVARGLLLAVVLGTALFFVRSDGRWSASVLAAHDRSVADRIAFVRSHFSPDTTAILAREDYQLARYYLAEYLAWLYDPAPARGAEPPKAPPPTVVIFTPGLELRQAVTLVPSPGEQLGLTVVSGQGLKLAGPYPIAREP
ncbi:MAG TPA: glycosyltransferase family 39 protein [Candidatus Limnocylindria bacterium]|nr:glycosyltransferase family 39 protein [Candidatus Limnocylindria bacterium]